VPTKTLSDATYSAVIKACRKGDELVEKGNLGAAIAAYDEALRLLPAPTTEWEAAAWVYAAKGDVLFQQGRYAEARLALEEAMCCPGGLGNPFLHLRLGQTYYELGKAEKAADELSRAYMGAGEKIFEGEDGKYLHLLKQALKPRDDN